MGQNSSARQKRAIARALWPEKLLNPFNKSPLIQSFSTPERVLRNRVVASGMEGVTAQNASETQITAPGKAILFYRIVGIAGATRRKAARLRKQRRDQYLICSNQTQKHPPDHRPFSCLRKTRENSSRSSAGESFSAPRRAMTTISFDGCGISSLESLNHSRMTLFMRLRLTADGQNRFCTTRPKR